MIHLLLVVQNASLLDVYLGSSRAIALQYYRIGFYIYRLAVYDGVWINLIRKRTNIELFHLILTEELIILLASLTKIYRQPVRRRLPSR